jgi:lysophospholipid hydrolase
MSSNWAKIKDLTFPITSYFNGNVFNAGIMRHFGDLRIEDLWLDYFCISTDITASKGVVHHNGMLWRYVRASMTLGPYLPPMCEVYPGDDNVHYLVDGGYVNNLPADEMKRLQGPLAIIAVDVGNYYDYGDRLSGCWQLWRNLIKPLFCRLLCCGMCERVCCDKNHSRCNNIKKQKPVPSMTDISTQLAYVCETRQLPDRLRNDIDLYLKPSVTKYGTLEFGKFGEIRDIGYNHTRISLLAWKEYLYNGGSSSVSGHRNDSGSNDSNENILLRECFRGGDNAFDDVIEEQEEVEKMDDSRKGERNLKK